MTITIRSFAETNIGRGRPTNQDHFLVAELAGRLSVLQSSIARNDPVAPTASVARVMAIADGMGGHQAGELAASLAISQVEEYLASHVAELAPDDQIISQHLEQAVCEAHSKIISVAQQQPSARGMGTTLTVAFLRWPDLWIAHAGDSRCYLLRDHELIQLTTDHTMAALLLRSGQLSSPAQAGSLNHMLWNCLGCNVNQLEVEHHRLRLQANDWLLLCSDGLSGDVPNDGIAEVLTTSRTVEAACKNLVQRANQAGGADNITVVACRMVPEGVADTWQSGRTDRTRFAPSDTVPYWPAERVPNN